ncbi:sodium:solute symporter family protein [Candidatus Babeliales bacterium]|nr:sodium:solute symporter family protein [Candidatus Babeliales bacterium]
MINIQLFLTLLTVFACIYLAIGLWAARSVHTLHNYFLANRNLSLLQLTFALIASQLGSGMILGTAYRSYHIGIWGILYTVGMSLGFLILACGLASRMRSLNIQTTAEIFETHYGSVSLKMFASLLSIVSLWGILVAQIVASKTLFAGLLIQEPYIFIMCWLFVICYTMLGGLQAIIMVDIAQVSFIITVFCAALWYSFPNVSSMISLLDFQSTHFDNSMTISSLAPALLIPTLFSLIEQDLGQKFFAAKNQTIATLSALLAGILIIVFASIPMILGMLAKVSALEIPAQANPLVAVILARCPEILFLLLMCGIIAAITSTANSLMCAISSNVIQDFAHVIPLHNNKLWITKIISAFIGLSALTASFFVHGDVISILQESYTLSVACLFVPTMAAYFSNRKKPALTAWISSLSGLTTYCVMSYCSSNIALRDSTTIALSIFGYYVGNYIVSYKK